MSFFEFTQNNSGGKFIPPAIWVFIEADSTMLALDRAQEVGLYFHGVDRGLDCPCCGDRWGIPFLNQEPALSEYAFSHANQGVPLGMVFYQDGTSKELSLPNQITFDRARKLFEEDLVKEFHEFEASLLIYTTGDRRFVLSGVEKSTFELHAKTLGQYRPPDGNLYVWSDALQNQGIWFGEVLALQLSEGRVDGNFLKFIEKMS